MNTNNLEEFVQSGRRLLEESPAAEIRLGRQNFDNLLKLVEAQREELKRARRVIAWLRSGGHNRFNQTAEGVRPESIHEHLASSPPEGLET